MNGRREDFISRVVESLWPPSTRDPRMGREEAVKFRRNIRDDTVVPWCSRAWEHVDFQEEYVALLSDPDRLARLSRGHLSEGDANALTESAVSAEKNGF